MRISRLFFLLFLSAAAGCGDDLRPADDGAPGPDGGGAVAIERQHAGGATSAVALAGGLTYVAVGPRLTIWRDGEQIGESAPLPGVVTDVEVSGERAFVVEHTDLAGELHVFDVSDPARPVETASLSLVLEGRSIPRAVAVDGERLFVADPAQGVHVVDIGDPDAPAVSRLVPHPDVMDVLIAGDRLYDFAYSEFGVALRALDLGADLAELGSAGLLYTDGVTVTPDDLAITAGLGGGIRVIDVSDLDNPLVRYTYRLEGGPSSRALAANSTTAWIPAEDGLYILDLSNPDDIQQRGPFDLDTAGALATTVAGPLLAVTNDRGELGVFDVSATEPARIARLPVTVCVDCRRSALAGHGDLLAIADREGGLRIATAANLALVGRLTVPAGMVDFQDVAVDGKLAYVADASYGLRIYDLANPATPSLRARVATAGYPSAVALDPASTRAYLAESTERGNLRVFDIATPAEASEIGATAAGLAYDVEIAGDLAYVTRSNQDDSLGVLRIFDIGDSSAIRPVSLYSENCRSARDVALAGDLAVVACHDPGGFHFLDVSDPARPVRRAVVPVPAPSSAWSVAAWPGGAALGHDRGVIIVDLANPSAPVTVEEHATAFAVRALAAPGDGRLIAGCGPGGVYQWALPAAD